MEHVIFLLNGSLRDLLTLDRLEKVDYGGNVPMYEENNPEWDGSIPDSPPTSFTQDQFAGWFYLPAPERLDMMYILTMTLA